MNCTLPGSGIKAFGKAIFCLAKLGDDVYLEALNDGLALKTVNNARSAYACFLFCRSFFLSYSGGGVVPADEEEGVAEVVLKCKISTKSCVSVFKSLSTLERTVDHCRLQLDQEDNKLIFVFHCRHGIVRTHNLGYQETDVVQAVFDKELYVNHLVLPARILSEVVSNFPNNIDEVTITMESAGVRLRNYVDDHEIDDRVSLTEISLIPVEFEKYQIGTDLSLTFCLKELKALLHFTDSISHSLSLKLEKAGKPIVISIDDDKDYQVDLVLATLLDELQPTSTATSTVNSTTTATQRQQHIATGQPHRIDLSDFEASEFYDEDHQSELTRGAECASQGEPSIRNRNTWKADSNTQFPSTSQDPRASSSNLQQVGHIPTLTRDSEFMETNPTPQPHSSTTVLSSKVPNRTSSHPVADDDDDVMDALFGENNMDEIAEDGRMFGFNHEREKDSANDAGKPENGFQDSIFDDSCFLPSTPPSKKFKPMSVLFGMEMFSSRHNDSEILAPDSDNDSS